MSEYPGPHSLLQRGHPGMHRVLTAWDFSPQKKMKLRGTKDLSIAAVGKYGTLQEFSFFDKVRTGPGFLPRVAVCSWLVRPVLPGLFPSRQGSLSSHLQGVLLGRGRRSGERAASCS